MKENPRPWARDAVALVAILREPVYIDHFLRALRESSNEVAVMSADILEAIQVVRAERWKPTVLGADNFEYEQDWTVVDTVTVELIDALADVDADLADQMDLCWQLALDLLETVPDDPEPAEQYLESESRDDPLNRAINRPYGNGLQAVLALGGWEHRNLGHARPLLEETLTRALEIHSTVGSGASSAGGTPGTRRSLGPVLHRVDRGRRPAPSRRRGLDRRSDSRPAP